MKDVFAVKEIEVRVVVVVVVLGVLRSLELLQSKFVWSSKAICGLGARQSCLSEPDRTEAPRPFWTLLGHSVLYKNQPQALTVDFLHGIW